MPEIVLYTFHANHAIVFDCMGDCLPIIVALGFILNIVSMNSRTDTISLHQMEVLLNMMGSI